MESILGSLITGETGCDEHVRVHDDVGYQLSPAMRS